MPMTDLTWRFVAVSALSDLLDRYLAKEKFRDLSNRQIAEAAGVSRGTIDNYRKGIHPAAPSEEILQAFHDLLGIPLTELRDAAGVPRGEPEPYSVPAEFNRLSHPQRVALNEFVRSFVGPIGDKNALPADPPEKPHAPPQSDKNKEANRSTDNPQLGPDHGLNDDFRIGLPKLNVDGERDEGEKSG